MNKKLLALRDKLRERLILVKSDADKWYEKAQSLEEWLTMFCYKDLDEVADELRKRCDEASKLREELHEAMIEYQKTGGSALSIPEAIRELSEKARQS